MSTIFKNKLLVIGAIIIIICLHLNYNQAAIYTTITIAIVSYFYIDDIDSHAFLLIFTGIPLSVILCVVDNVGVGVYFCFTTAGLLITQLIIDFIIGVFNVLVSFVFINFIETEQQKQLRHQAEMKCTAQRAKLFYRSRYQYNLFYWL